MKFVIFFFVNVLLQNFAFAYFMPEYAVPKAILFSLHIDCEDRAYCLAMALEQDNFIQQVSRIIPSVVFTPTGSSLGSAVSNSDQILIYDIGDEASSNIWARDWGPITGMDSDENNKTAYFFQYPRESAVPVINNREKILSNYVYDGIHTDTAFQFEGGNLMVGQNGQCFTGVDGKGIVKFPDYYEKRRQILLATGCREVYFLKNPEGERTGHIDVYVKIISENKVILADYDRASSKAFMQENEELLKQLNYEVVRIRNPSTLTEMLTYVNSLIIGKNAFVPIYNHEYDDSALSVYRELGFEVTPIPLKEIIKLHGALRCMTAPLF